MNLLLDTNVFVEAQRPSGSAVVRQYVAELNPTEAHISVITVGELHRGVLLMPAGRRRDVHAAWLRAVQRDYGERILDIDRDTAELWGEISARAQRSGQRVPLADGLIAATAIRHGLHVVTRNTRHFIDAGALVVNPWDE